MRMSSRLCDDRQRGFALVVVLWIVTLLALQVSLFNLTVRDAAALAGNELAVLRGEALAAAAVEVAAARLLDRDAERRWQADGTTREIAFGGAYLAITIKDEAARIDVNEADAELLGALLQRSAGISGNIAQLVDRIIDWRDADSDRRPRGAEELDYRRAGMPGGPNNGPLLDASELARVLGFPPDAAHWLANYLTVYGGEGNINPMLAPREVLLMLPGVEEAQVDRALELRRRGAESAQSVPAELGSAKKWLTARKGPAYRIELAVRGDTVPAIGTAEAVILLGKDTLAPYRILSWRYEPRMWEAQGSGDRQ